MIEISVNQTKTNSFLNGLGRFIRSLTFKDPIDEALDILKKEAEANFDQQGRLYSRRGSWQPLKPATVRQRGSARPILIRTGRLKGSFKKAKVSKDVGVLRNVDPVAKYHQEGTRKMPRREIIGVTDKFKGALQRVVSNYIFKEISKSLR